MAEVSNPLPEPWLRGPVPGIPAELQPVAHAIVMAQEEVERLFARVSEDQLWARPGGAASAGFHVAHLSGSSERLLTYAHGSSLSRAQLDELAAEREIDAVRPSKDELLRRWRNTSTGVLDALGRIDPATLLDERLVGRGELPSNVIGLLFHIGEHASRHIGQLATTVKVVTGGQAE